MRTLLTATLAVLAACSSSHKSNEVSDDEARKLLLDRNWLDRMPETERDRLHVYRFVPSMGGGVFQDRTLFKGTFELFSFKVDGTKILFDLHETKTKVASEFTIDLVGWKITAECMCMNSSSEPSVTRPFSYMRFMIS